MINRETEKFIQPMYYFLAFSLSQWYVSNGLTLGSNLTTLEARTLLESLGVGHFLQDVGCQRTGSVYNPSVDGWKSGAGLKNCIKSRINPKHKRDKLFQGHLMSLSSSKMYHTSCYVNGDLGI